MNQSELKNILSELESYRSKAYAPYSNFMVGAVAITKNGNRFGGCNVENASYGGTICAERVALTRAVAQGCKEFESIFVGTNAKTVTPPCGICLQVMAEFFDETTKIHLVNHGQLEQSFTLKDLLPRAFGSGNL